MRVLFKAFDSKMASREKLFKAASEFASAIGRDRLITVSHSEDRDNIVITIWYWGEEEMKWDGKAKVGQFQRPAEPAAPKPADAAAPKPLPAPALATVEAASPALAEPKEPTPEPGV